MKLLCVGGAADGRHVGCIANRVMIPVMEYGSFGHDIYERRGDQLIFVEHEKPPGLRYAKGGPLDGMWFNLDTMPRDPEFNYPIAVKLFDEKNTDGPGHWYVKNEDGEYAYQETR